jgi:GNAT superfamily N-acetyltransferase
MSIQIRKAQAADTTDLSKLFLESRRRAFHWHEAERYQLGDFQTQTAGEVVSLAIDDDKRILGFISVSEPDRFIHHLHVSTDYQRSEIGSLLLHSLKSWLPQPYRLQCLAANQRGCAFYTKSGWREVERGTGDDGEYLVFEFGIAGGNKVKPALAAASGS